MLLVLRFQRVVRLFGVAEIKENPDNIFIVVFGLICFLLILFLFGEVVNVREESLLHEIAAKFIASLHRMVVGFHWIHRF